MLHIVFSATWNSNMVHVFETASYHLSLEFGSMSYCIQQACCLLFYLLPLAGLHLCKISRKPFTGVVLSFVIYI